MSSVVNDSALMRLLRGLQRTHVTLVDVSETPVERLTENGVVVNGKTYEADVVFARRALPMTGSFDRMHIVGRDGLTLKEKWAAGPGISWAICWF